MDRTITYTLAGIDESNLDPGDKMHVKVVNVTFDKDNNPQVKLQRISEPPVDLEAELRGAVMDRTGGFDWLRGMVMSNLIIADKIGTLIDEVRRR